MARSSRTPAVTSEALPYRQHRVRIRPAPARMCEMAERTESRAAGATRFPWRDVCSTKQDFCSPTKEFFAMNRIFKYLAPVAVLAAAFGVHAADFPAKD